MRCGLAAETTEHHLWECPADDGERQTILPQVLPVLRAITPQGLPNCLRRCGLVPMGFFVCDAQVAFILEYFARVSALASIALARSRAPPADDVGAIRMRTTRAPMGS